MVNDERLKLQKEREAREKEKNERKEEERKKYEERKVKRVEPAGGRWEFRFRDVKVDEVDGERDRRGVGVRYGMPHEDRKKGQIKIPRRVDCV